MFPELAHGLQNIGRGDGYCAHVAVCFDTVHRQACLQTLKFMLGFNTVCRQAYLDFLKLMLGFDAMRNEISFDVGDIRFNPVKAWVYIGSTASTTTVTIAYFKKLDANLASVSSTRLLILMAA